MRWPGCATASCSTRWSRFGADDCPAQPLPTDPDWAGGSLHEQVFERRVDADAETLWRAFESIGAKRRWQVEHTDRPHLLRLRADVRLPGRLWLELSVHEDSDGGSRYRLRALFQPYGLAGEAFWTASTPFRHAVLGGIARDISVERPQRRRFHANITHETIAAEKASACAAPVQLAG